MSSADFLPRPILGWSVVIKVDEGLMPSRVMARPVVSGVIDDMMAYNTGRDKIPELGHVLDDEKFIHIPKPPMESSDPVETDIGAMGPEINPIGETDNERSSLSELRSLTDVGGSGRMVGGPRRSYGEYDDLMGEYRKEMERRTPKVKSASKRGKRTTKKRVDR